MDFPAFVRDSAPALLRSAYLLTGSAADAEDLVQDTLLALYRRWDRVAAADAPLAYARRSLVNTFLNSRRRPATRREVVVSVLPNPREPAESAPDGDDETVWELLATLPPRQRAALVLRYFHDLPDAEIAAALGCRPGTVRSLLSRGLAALRASVALRPGGSQR